MPDTKSITDEQAKAALIKLAGKLKNKDPKNIHHVSEVIKVLQRDEWDTDGDSHITSKDNSYDLLGKILTGNIDPKTVDAATYKNLMNTRELLSKALKSEELKTPPLPKDEKTKIIEALGQALQLVKDSNSKKNNPILNKLQGSIEKVKEAIEKDQLDNNFISEDLKEIALELGTVAQLNILNNDERGRFNGLAQHFKELGEKVPKDLSDVVPLSAPELQTTPSKPVATKLPDKIAGVDRKKLSDTFANIYDTVKDVPLKNLGLPDDEGYEIDEFRILKNRFDTPGSILYDTKKWPDKRIHTLLINKAILANKFADELKKLDKTKESESLQKAAKELKDLLPKEVIDLLPK